VSSVLPAVSFLFTPAILPRVLTERGRDLTLKHSAPGLENEVALGETPQAPRLEHIGALCDPLPAGRGGGRSGGDCLSNWPDRPVVAVSVAPLAGFSHPDASAPGDCVSRRSPGALTLPARFCSPLPVVFAPLDHWRLAEISSG